jgi:hypothetical protein
VILERLRFKYMMEIVTVDEEEMLIHTAWPNLHKDIMVNFHFKQIINFCIY